MNLTIKMLLEQQKLIAAKFDQGFHYVNDNDKQLIRLMEWVKQELKKREKSKLKRKLGPRPDVYV